MLVLLLSILRHRKGQSTKEQSRTGQTHSCLRLPPFWKRGTRHLTDALISCHIQSAPSCLYHPQIEEIANPSFSSNQQLQAVLIRGFLWGTGGQEGGGHRGSCCRGDIEECVAVDAGGCRVAEGCSCCDAGEIDAKCEPCLLQGLLWHSKGLQLLLTIGHV